MSAPEVDESSPTLARSFPMADPISPTDVVGAVLGFVVACLGVAGVPELLKLSPSQVAAILGVVGALAGAIRHLARQRAADKGI